MDRNRKIILTIILCLFAGSIFYALFTGEREPFLYAMNNKMNYDTNKEEIDVVKNDPVTIDEEIELSTETTTEQNNRKEKKTEKKTNNDDEKVSKSNKSDKESDQESDEESDQESSEEGENGGDNIEGGDDNAPVSKKLVELICTWKDSDKLLYGKAMKTSDIHVTGKYDNGDTENIPIENCTINGFDSNKLGEGTCTISYYGFSRNMSYTILNYELSIFCDSWDKRYQYRYGDNFLNSDIIVKANMADGSKENVLDFNVSGIQMDSVGEHVCIISYKNFTLSEDYNVRNYPLSLESSINKFTVRGAVTWDEIVDGQTIKANMADGTVKELSSTDYLISGYPQSVSGSHELNISYDGVMITIPYVVYYDSLKVDMGGEIGKSVDIHFTTSLDITSAESLGLEEEYTDAESGIVYILEGIYNDSGYVHEFEFPKSYTANKRFRINSEGLPWHEYAVYAKYVKK